jgi:hypothetical protein
VGEVAMLSPFAGVKAEEKDAKWFTLVGRGVDELVIPVETILEFEVLWNRPLWVWTRVFYSV